MNPAHKTSSSHSQIELACIANTNLPLPFLEDDFPRPSSGVSSTSLKESWFHVWAEFFYEIRTGFWWNHVTRLFFENSPSWCFLFCFCSLILPFLHQSSLYKQPGLIPLAVLIFLLFLLTLCVQSKMDQFEQEKSCRIILLVMLKMVTLQYLSSAESPSGGWVGWKKHLQ